MKVLSKILLILATATLFNSSQTQAALIDKIKAVVNNEVITQSEIDRLLYPIYTGYHQIYNAEELKKKLEEASEDILNQLIEDRLILSEAKRLNVTVEEGEIDKKIEELKSDFPGEKGLLKTLHEQNLTIKDLRDRFRNQTMIEKAIDLQIRSRIQILPQETENFYRSHIDRFKQPERVKVSSILIRLKGERAPEESFVLATEILNRLKDGEDFYTLAKNYSEGMNAERGGDMGYVSRGQMREEIDKIIFGLNIGEFSDLVKSSLGYHIFKSYDKRKQRVIPLLEAQGRVLEAIYRKKVEGKFREWIEGLRENAFISIK